MRSGVVADQMEVLAGRGSNAERLLHQSIWLVSVSVRSLSIHILILVTASSTIGRFPSNSSCWWWNELASSSLALHLSVSQETTGNSACTP